MKYQLLATVTGAVLLMGSSAHAASFIGLGDLPGGRFYSFATAVSADGTVVVGGGSSGRGSEAFRWEDGTIMALGDLPGGSFFSEARSVSADGAVVVGSSSSFSGLEAEAFRWENGRMLSLGSLPGDIGSFAADVSADGAVIVGSSRRTDSTFEAFRWENGVMTALLDLPDNYRSSAEGISPDGTVVVGGSTSVNRFGFEAFRWEDGVMTPLGSLPGRRFRSGAYDVSADGGVIVGQADFEAFRWEDGVMTALGGGGMTAWGVSADGAVIVGQGRGSNGNDAFYWNRMNGTRSLQDLLTGAGIDLAGWQLSSATGVSADGLTVVGFGTNPSGELESWLARLDAIGNGESESIPEPSVLIGLIGIGTAVLCKRRGCEL